MIVNQARCIENKHANSSLHHIDPFLKFLNSFSHRKGSAYKTMPFIELGAFLYYHINVRTKKGREQILACFAIMSLIFFLHRGIGQESSEPEEIKKEPLSKWSKQWLEEVVLYIITPEEKEVFKNLPNEVERGKFIENFWRIRDPNPATAENEFKAEYYKRIAMANKFLTSSATPGWRTDRGRIYILLGPPNEIHQDFSPSGSFAASSNVTNTAREVWTYMGLPGKKLPYTLDFTFVDRWGTGDYVLMGEVPYDLSSMHFQFDYMENLAEVTKTPYENLKELQGIITTQVTYDLIPLKYSLFYWKGAERETYMPLVIKIPYANLPNKEIEGKHYFSLTLLINISNKLGQIIHQRSKDINFNYTQAELDALSEKDFQIQTFLSLEPESYKIHLLALDNFSGKIGTLHQEISVPEFEENELAMSDIILSHKPYETERKVPTGKRDSLERIFSEVNETFSPDQELNICFEVYNLALDPERGRNDFSIEYFFFQNKDLIVHISPSRSSPTSQNNCRVRNSFQLRNFKPGIYRLQVKVIDRISGKSADRDTGFIIQTSSQT